MCCYSCGLKPDPPHQETASQHSVEHFLSKAHRAKMARASFPTTAHRPVNNPAAAAAFFSFGLGRFIQACLLSLWIFQPAVRGHKAGHSPSHAWSLVIKHSQNHQHKDSRPL